MREACTVSLILMLAATLPAQPVQNRTEAPVRNRTDAEVVEAETAATVLPDGGVVLLLTVFTLALFVGVELIIKVPPTLHTPLMSGSNAISGITVVGAMLSAGSSSWLAGILGMVAVALATLNVVGGYLVTHRMLGMFRKDRS